MGTSEEVVVLPVRATVDDSYQLIKCCTQLESGKDVILDASRCERFGPLGVALAAASLARRRQSGLPVVKFVAPRDPGARTFLREVGFERALRGTAERADSRNTLELRQLHALDPTYIDEVSGLLAERVPGFPERVRFLIDLCLKELLQNVFEWARSPIGCFVQTRWHARDRNLRLALVDGGIGIPASLRSHKIQNLQRERDEEIIVAAVMRKGLSARRGRPGGLGLKTIREIATDRLGKLTVVSQGAKVTFRSDGPRPARTLQWRGTAIEIDFRPDVVVKDNSPVEEVF